MKDNNVIVCDNEDSEAYGKVVYSDISFPNIYCKKIRCIIFTKNFENNYNEIISQLNKKEIYKLLELKRR